MASEALGPLPPQSETLDTRTSVSAWKLGCLQRVVGEPTTDPRPRQTPWEDAGDCTQHVCVDPNCKPQWTE